MIRSFTIHDPQGTHIKWFGEVDTLKQPRTFEFKPGLNILWGKNGSGKTTVIKAMARLLHCEQSGDPVVTKHSVSELGERFRFGNEKPFESLKTAMTLDHDGQGCRYFDPSNTVGLQFGGTSFDYDFMDMGMRNTMFKGSAGQTTSMRFDKLIGQVLKRQHPELEWRVDRERANDVWREKLDVIEHFLQGSGDKGPPTIFLDEPTRSLDIPYQLRLWKFIRCYQGLVQFIVASHSLFALMIPEANYIEMTKGYLEESLLCRAALHKWHEMECKPVPVEAIEKAYAKEVGQ